MQNRTTGFQNFIFNPITYNPLTMPSINAIRKAILAYLEDEEIHKIIEVTNKMALNFKLTNMERVELTPAGNSKFDGRVRWAVSTLRKALLLENVENKLGIFRITQTGLKAIRSNPQLINDTFLMQFPTYREWKQSTSDIQKINKETTKEQLHLKFGLVSYIDMLGTKEFQTNSNPQNIPTKWNTLVEKFQKSLEYTIKDAVITFNSFSDTIIITLEHKDPKYLLKNFAIAAWHIIPESIKADIPIRGCFSIGNFFHKNNFFVGTAITEAAQYYELPQWIGITASPSAHIKIEKLSKKDPSFFTYYHKYSIPLKHSFEQEAWTIKWPELYDTMNLAQNKSSDILDIIDEKLESVTDVDISLKWRNTKKIYKDMFTGYSRDYKFTVSLDRPAYPLGSKIYVQANMPYAVDGIPIQFKIFNSKGKLMDAKTINTGPDYLTHPDSGIYEVDFKADGDNWKVYETYTVQVTYVNRTEKNMFVVDQVTPVIQTDKDMYAIGSNMIVTVVDPNSNMDSNAVEYVGDHKDSKLTITTKHDRIDTYRLEETGNSTGVFQGVIGILGRRRDGTIVPFNTGTEIIERTQGTGGKDGYIAASPGDEITFTYQYGSKAASVLCRISEDMGI